MQWLGTITIVGAVALAILLWQFLRLRSQDMIGELMNKRKPTSRIVSRANYMEGLAVIPVALALTDDCFYYENADLQASVDLNRIEEVEYDDETATGRSISVGKALRLRSHGHSFEFVLDPASAREWEKLLPPHHFNDATAQAV